MNPAFSVVLFTTLAGAGQGLFLALFTVQCYAFLGLVPPAAGDRHWIVVGSVIALGLLAAGLLASFFHLGRPERAWRAAAMWRTSWLSREVIVLPAFMAAVAGFGLAHALAGSPPPLAAGLSPLEALDATLLLGIAGTVLAFALFICTGMIYASLRFLAEWHTALTPLNFTLMGGASGFALASALAAAIEPDRVGLLAGWALILTAAAAIGRVASLVRNARLKPKSTVQSAIGAKHPQVVQRSMGFMGGSFNTREFFHRARPSVLRAVKPGFLLGAFVLPLALLVFGRGASGQAALVPLALAFAVQYVGLVAERWFFFAEARHPQNLYYQAVA